jgi:Dyp-type peroxidase family
MKPSKSISTSAKQSAQVSTTSTDPNVADLVPLTADELGQIQGNCLGGFLKDHQAMIFLRFTDKDAARKTLAGEVGEECELADDTILKDVAESSSHAVLRFNGQFKALRSRGVREGTIQATWTNLLFTRAGMEVFNAKDTDKFPDAFKEGMKSRAEGKLTDKDLSKPDNWDKVVDWDPETMHAVLIVASDDSAQIDPENADGRVAKYVAMITAAGSGIELAFPKDNLGNPVDPTENEFQRPGIIFGKTRLDEPGEVGHEHFGFKDGVSQPGVRAVDAPDDPVGNPDQGHAGQDLLHAGEFVIGYNRQIPFEKPGHDGPNPDPGIISGSGFVFQKPDGGGDDQDIDPLGSREKLPDWTKNGSFMVFRRLEQDVRAFREFINATAAQLGLSAEEFGAKLVGRFRSGAPIEKLRSAQNQDAANPLRLDPAIANPALADDDSLNNDFEFDDDEDGEIAPLAAHIRKAYPRDQEPHFEAGHPVEEAEQKNAEHRTQTHRLLRRGIPYGPSLFAASDDGVVTRGLLFLAYQSDIERQFEFVMGAWINEEKFPRDNGDSDTFGDSGVSGRDPIMSPRQASVDASPMRGCPFHEKAIPAAGACPVSIKHFVTTRGGGYFFAPSIYALQNLLAPDDCHNVIATSDTPSENAAAEAKAPKSEKAGESNEATA